MFTKIANGYLLKSVVENETLFIEAEKIPAEVKDWLEAESDRISKKAAAAASSDKISPMALDALRNGIRDVQKQVYFAQLGQDLPVLNQEAKAA